MAPKKGKKDASSTQGVTAMSCKGTTVVEFILCSMDPILLDSVVAHPSNVTWQAYNGMTAGRHIIMRVQSFGHHCVLSQRLLKKDATLPNL